MGAKDNFNQAMQEIFPFYKASKSSAAEEPSAEESANESAQATGAEQPQNEPLTFASFTPGPQEYDPGTPPEDQIKIETTYITRDTKITGKVVSMSNLDISGEINGDIESQHSICVSGKIEGNISGKDVELNGATIKGNIHASQRLIIINKSLVVGNVSASEMELNSRINGNINVKKEISIQSDSSVVGDISAMSIGIQKGASIKGVVTTLGDGAIEDEEKPE